MSLVAVASSVACFAYGMSLALQRAFPSIRDALTLSLAEGLKPTYYLRVLMALFVGALSGFVFRKLAVSERRLAWGTAIAVGASIVLIVVFP
jgi:hypothetical protein